MCTYDWVHSANRKTFIITMNCYSNVYYKSVIQLALFKYLHVESLEMDRTEELVPNPKDELLVLYYQCTTPVHLSRYTMTQTYKTLQCCISHVSQAAEQVQENPRVVVPVYKVHSSLSVQVDSSKNSINCLRFPEYCIIIILKVVVEALVSTPSKLLNCSQSETMVKFLWNFWRKA